ncbi:MAG: hypothetical protein HC915_08110 [Anaerolineae bacterium]|nr:hypothetical protein [Anaerolineae bacterium]
MFTRFRILGGGRIQEGTGTPTPADLWPFLRYARDALRATLEAPAGDAASWLLAGAVVLLSLGVLLGLPAPRTRPRGRGSAARWQAWVHHPLYLFGLGVGIIILGLVPFLLANYVPSARTYASATAGFALVLGGWFSLWRPAVLQGLALGLAALWLGSMALHHAELRHDRREAARQRELLFNQVLDLVPDVAPQTGILLLNFQLDYGSANVIAGETGLITYFQMLYDEPSISAHFLYFADHPLLDQEGRLAVVSEAGTVARRRNPADPISHDELLILYQDNLEVQLIDTLTPETQFDGRRVGIRWEAGQTQIRSNAGQIVQPSPEALAASREKICCIWGALGRGPDRRSPSVPENARRWLLHRTDRHPEWCSTSARPRPWGAGRPCAH